MSHVIEKREKLDARSKQIDLYIVPEGVYLQSQDRKEELKEAARAGIILEQWDYVPQVTLQPITSTKSVQERTKDIIEQNYLQSITAQYTSPGEILKKKREPESDVSITVDVDLEGGSDISEKGAPQLNADTSEKFGVSDVTYSLSQSGKSRTQDDNTSLMKDKESQPFTSEEMSQSLSQSVRTFQYGPVDILERKSQPKSDNIIKATLLDNTSLTKHKEYQPFTSQMSQSLSHPDKMFQHGPGDISDKKSQPKSDNIIKATSLLEIPNRGTVSLSLESREHRCITFNSCHIGQIAHTRNRTAPICTLS